jgi:hypothetical protein
MFRRYSPPTSYSAWLIWPSELYLTASMSAANRFLRSRRDLLEVRAASRARARPWSRTGSALDRGGQRGVAVGAERLDVRDLLLLFLVGGADQLDLGGDVAGVLARQVGVHADQRQRAVVLLGLVVEAFLLDLAALVHGVHGAEHAAALADRLELLVHGLFDQVGQRLGDEAALPGVLAEVQPSSRLMMSWIATARRTLSSVGVVMASS